MSDEDSSPSYLPWIVAGLVLVVGGAKVDAARPVVARALALAGPVLPVVIGLKRLEGSPDRIEKAATAVAWLTILAGEACVIDGFFRVTALDALVPVARGLLYVAALAALVVGTLDARSGGKSRFASYIGMAAGFALWLSSQPSRDGFGSVFGAFFVGFFLGGGSGLIVGELLGRAFKKA